jgi:hypothetical protein
VLFAAATCLALSGAVAALAAGTPGEKVTPHLRVAWYAQPGTVGPNTPGAIVIEVVPAPGIRVYAPGQLGYIPVSLTVTPHARLKIGEARLPKPVEHVFPPTGERSLVSDKAFRMEFPVSLADAQPGAGASSTVTVDGVFEYQACDDTLCFRPAKVRMSWTFEVTRSGKAAGGKKRGTV